jgi:hypothetical protein
MTFDDVAASLPNGFHDAERQRFEMEHARGTKTTWIYLGALNCFLLFSAGNASGE